MSRESQESLAKPSERIDEVCSKFRSSLEAGENPKIDDFVAGWKEPERSKLISELQIDHRWHKGEQPSRLEIDDKFDKVGVTEVFEQCLPEADTVVEPNHDDTLVVNSQLGHKRFHAKGGLGLVYVAADKALNREVAIKFIRPNLSQDQECRERFLLEAEITSRLEHPGVVPVYGLGQTQEGGLFYAMRFIQGQTLDSAIKAFHDPAPSTEPPPDTRSQDREVQFRELLARFVAVCKTIAYSHNRGIVHRDIKPANVMLGRYGETLVVDWGLATPVGRTGVFKDEAEKTLLPGSGSGSSSTSEGIAGTPAFMSPEQASGAVPPSPASDVYSLGATLYTLLCGKAPFAGSLHSVRSDVISGHFKRPSEMKKGVPKPLEAICLKAMQLKPEDRYDTALALAHDIENHLADADVAAYQEPLLSKAARWSRRHRGQAQALLGALLLLTLLGVFGAVIMARQAQVEGSLREDSLRVSAQFAASTIANKVDIRLRLLEKEAADPELHRLLQEANQDVESDLAKKPLEQWLADREPLQQWLEACAQRNADLATRSWFICAVEGTQVARDPKIDPRSGKISTSLSTNYCWRDYFHGKHRDYHEDKEIRHQPLPHVNVSVGMAATNDGALSIVFSAPIRPVRSDQRIGVLGMSVELGEFADLEIDLPGQDVLLIDTREYYLQRKMPDGTVKKDRGEGLVLQHKDLRDREASDRLYHLHDDSVRLMDEWNEQRHFLPKTYRDPVATSSTSQWKAAFAPVLMNGRPTSLRNTGWFVIVQQQR